MSSNSLREIIGTLGEIPVVLAPQFEVNDLAFRMLVRKYNIKLCWTGMVNSHMWATMPTSRNSYFQTCEIDRPLIIQMSGNGEEELIACAKDLQQFGVAIDINFGCTQHIARRGQYGYFMVNNENKRKNVIEMVKNIVSAINVPLSVKIRLIDGEDGKPDVDLTANFAKELESAGVSLISVHGRAKNSNKAGPVDAEAIKKIVESVSIPVMANGGVKTMQEAQELFKESGAAGIMVGQGLLMNPKAFSDDPEHNPIAISREYLDLWDKYPDPNFFIARRHIFYFFDDIVRANKAVGDRLKTTHSIEELRTFLDDYENGKFNAEQ